MRPMTMTNKMNAKRTGRQPQQPRVLKRDVNGILLLDKPVGLTSNQALQMAKRLYRARKAGHTGSLDPLASGMLPLCFGQATKVSTWLLNADKVYEVEANIGTRTDTADADGQVIEESEVTTVTREQLELALAAHRGEIDQIPPMFSALKHEGRRLYELAREGKEVPRKSRRVTIHEIEIETFDPHRPRLRVRCSKGTYVRTLVESIGEAMGTVAHVSALKRISVQPFEDKPLISQAQLEVLADDPAALDTLLLPVDSALEAQPDVQLSANEAFYLRNGHAVSHVSRDVSGFVRLYDENHLFLGVGEVLDDGRVAPRRLFTMPENSAG
jgi:tRNA pseudouridine55 synthase